VTLYILDNLLAHLPVDGWKEMVGLILRFPGLFSDTPTHLIEHDNDVGDTDPIHQRFYRVSSEKLHCLDAEVRYMLESEIVEPSFIYLFFTSIRSRHIRGTDNVFADALSCAPCSRMYT
jgi:hypothetical protein